jgi:hypothetical protein
MRATPLPLAHEFRRYRTLAFQIKFEPPEQIGAPVEHFG